MYLPTPPCIHIHMVMHYDTDMTNLTNLPLLLCSHEQ